MSSVAPNDEQQAHVNGTAVLRPRLADRIARLQMQSAVPTTAPPPDAMAAPPSASQEPRHAPDAVASEQNAIEAASRLVTLIAEQRNLLERLHQVTTTAPPTREPEREQEPDPQPLADALASPPFATLPPPIEPSLSIAQPSLFLPQPAPMPPLQPPPVRADRPPMIIERAQAEYLAGGVARELRPELSRLPGLVIGFGIALAIGVVLYLSRMGG